MSREWKPGDVALVRLEGGEVRVGLKDTHGWATCNDHHDRSSAHWTTDKLVTPIRPLVVIDPEDRDRAGRLSRLFLDEYSKYDRRLIVGGSADAMQAALGRLLVPPKPEEPQGLGAVVEAIHGNIFVRVSSDTHPWIHAQIGSTCRWEDISVVRVLSDGWAPDASEGAS